MDKPEDESLHGWLKWWMGQYWVRGCIDKRVVGIVHTLAKVKVVREWLGSSVDGSVDGWTTGWMGQWMGE